MPFSQAWEWQRKWQQQLLAAEGSDQEAVWILQHPSCFTLGRGATEDYLRFDPENAPAPLHRIDRGGEVTHHAPGQLVAYPVLDLRRREPDHNDVLSDGGHCFNDRCKGARCASSACDF